uniref:Uncharacterized protein n=2 Tax=Aegilops tauschii subsp. strangulata TaxID=200361 RepID=A0A453PWU9_AEGTS
SPQFPKSALPVPVKHAAMPPRKKRGARPAANQPPPSPPKPPGPDASVGEKLRWSADQEFVRRKAAIRAIQAAETESILSRLHLVRSYISKEQLETPALQFFQENLPNVSVVRNEEQGELELKWKDWDDLINGDQRHDKVSRASITSLATAPGFHFSGDSGSNAIYLLLLYLYRHQSSLTRMIFSPYIMRAVQKNFIESSFDFNNFNWSELPESQTIGAPDSLQTPGVCV